MRFDFMTELQKTNNISKNSGAFTLVELAVVIVIIGFIIGGVLVGKSMIRSSQVLALTADIQKFKSAIDMFQKKYNALPGDMFNAQNYWGAAANCTSDQTTLATCNGDGDGKIESNAASGAIGNENFLLWKHLANAELIKGSYVGRTDGSTNYSATDRNSPSTKLKNGLWYTENFGTIPPSSDWGGNAFNGVYDHTLEVGARTANTRPVGGIITANEASALDSKIDDSKPGTGNMRARITWQLCTIRPGTTASPASSEFDTAVYNFNGRTASTDNICVLEFPMAF